MGLSVKKKKRLKILKRKIRCEKKIYKLRRTNLKMERSLVRQALKSFINFNFYLNSLNLNIEENLTKLDFFNYDFGLDKDLKKVYFLKNKFIYKNIYILTHKKPKTPSKRHYKYIKKSVLVRKNIFLKTSKLKYTKKIGKNQLGQIVNKHHQIGLKTCYRNVVKTRLPLIHQGIVEQLEYTPNHSTLLIRIYNPLINYHFYIYYPQNIKIGFYIKTKMDDDSIIGKDNFNKLGDSNTLFNIIPGKPVHNINLHNQNNIACSSGSFCIILQKYKNYCLVKFPSKKTFYILSNSQATLGRMSNLQNKLCNLGKAGRNRWFGKRPHVRGVAMNPIDHPHGGGQGKTSGGQPSVSPWGKPTKQIKHRKYVVYEKNKKFVKVLEIIKKKKYEKVKK